MADIPDREKHESTFRNALTRMMAKHRKELERIAGWPPDLDRVPAEFWVRVEEDLRKQNEAALLLLFVLTTARHGVDGEAGRQLARSYVAGRSASVASRFATNSRERLETLQKDITTTTTVATKAAFRGRLSSILGPDRADSLAVTETTAATSAGSAAAVAARGLVSESDRWITENDDRVCRICNPLHRTRRDNWARLFPLGPPAHVRCRCWLKYSEVS